MKLPALLIGLITASAFVAVAASESKFFANSDIQKKSPLAFVLQPESEQFIRTLQSETLEIRENLVRAIKDTPDLYRAIHNWDSLSFEEQVPYLQQIFALEVKN